MLYKFDLAVGENTHHYYVPAASEQEACERLTAALPIGSQPHRDHDFPPAQKVTDNIWRAVV